MSADAAVAVDIGANGGRWRDGDVDLRATRGDLPCHRDQQIPALAKPEDVVAGGAGAGARGHPSGHGPGLHADVAQRAGLAGVARPFDRTTRAGPDNAGEERGGARWLRRARHGLAHAA